MYQFNFDFFTIQMKDLIFLNITNRVEEILNIRCEQISMILDQIEKMMKHCIV